MNKKEKPNMLYLAVLLTVLLTRIYVILTPYHLRINGAIIHHFWIGVILFGISLLISKKYEKTKVVTLGIGIGLIIDEFVYIILGGQEFSQYWAWPSILGAVILLIILYIFRKKLV